MFELNPEIFSTMADVNSSSAGTAFVLATLGGNEIHAPIAKGSYRMIAGNLYKIFEREDDFISSTSESPAKNLISTNSSNPREESEIASKDLENQLDLFLRLYELTLRKLKKANPGMKFG